MNKKELAAKVAKQLGTTNVSALKTVDAVFSSLRDSIEKGETVIFHGFGSFSVRMRLERKGVNPSTKQPMQIVAKKVVKFTASRSIEIQ